MSIERSARRGSDRSPAGSADGGADGEAAGDAAVQSSQKKPQDEESRARDTVYRLLASRSRSQTELHQALSRKGIDEDIAAATIQKFVKAGLVDDAEFAEAWVQSRHHHQGLGRKALGFELRRKGVSEHQVAEALSQVDEESEAERARELVQRKLRGMPSVDNTAKMRRLVGMLARKGYSESLAFRIAREEIEKSSVDESDLGDENPML